MKKKKCTKIVFDTKNGRNMAVIEQFWTVFAPIAKCMNMNNQNTK